MRHIQRIRLVLVLLLVLLAAGAAFVPHALLPVSAQAIPGTIAYVRDNDATGDEIRLIEPDGSNDRRIYSTGLPDPYGDIFKLTELDWRPDAGELAFSAEHEQACSIHETDIYGIRPDGSGYRRITSGPACAALASYPKGRVTVTVRNFTSRTALYVYVQGAPEALPVIGSQTTVTFDRVADFGDSVLQQAVVIGADGRWAGSLAQADVISGQTVHAGTLDVLGAGVQQSGARLPRWHSDGSRLGWIISGCGGMWEVPADPPAGAHGNALLATFALACVMDWGPTQALANQLLYGIYGTDYGIYRVTEGSADKGEKLLAWTDLGYVLDLQWLPDGSGFLFMKTGNFHANGNIFEYSFATKQVTQRTHFTNEFAGAFGISPDGQYVVFERGSQLGYDGVYDVWVMRRDGTEMRLLARDGMLPAWSPRALPEPLTPRSYLPLVQR